MRLAQASKWLSQFLVQYIKHVFLYRRFVDLITKAKLADKMFNLCRAHPDEFTTQWFQAGGRSTQTLTLAHAPDKRVIAVMFGMVQTCNLITASTAVNSKKIKEITVSPFTIEGLRLQSLLAMVFKTLLVALTFDKELSFWTYIWKSGKH